MDSFVQLFLKHLLHFIKNVSDIFEVFGNNIILNENNPFTYDYIVILINVIFLFFLCCLGHFIMLILYSNTNVYNLLHHIMYIRKNPYK